MPPSESEIRQKAQPYRMVGRWGVALTLAVALCLTGLSPATAQEEDPAENFQFSYAPVSFDKNEIHGGEVFG